MSEIPPLDDGSLAKFIEPLNKLVDAVRAATGVVYEPTAIRRRAKADRDAALLKAETDAEISLIAAQADADVQALASRARHRLAVQELRRQNNIELVLDEAAQALPPNVSGHPVDPDWISGFFSDVQDISNSDLQRVVGKLLAGEFATPGSVSRRTVALVKQMSPNEVQKFRSLCRLVWRGDGYLIPCDVVEAQPLKKWGISVDDLLELDASGLYQFTPLTFSPAVGDTLSYFHHQHTVRQTRFVHGGVLAFYLTRSGGELFEALQVDADENFYAESMADMERQGLWLRQPPPAPVSPEPGP